MHYVSLIVEFLRGRPVVVFWTAALSQAALWLLVPTLFYSAPPDGLSDVLFVGHEFQLGSHFGPPLAFWLAELSFKALGLFGVYLLAQVCVVTAYWALFKLGQSIVGMRHAALAVLLMVGISALTVQTPDFGPAVLAMPLWALSLLHFWRAIGEGRRGFWLLLAVELGLLLLTSYAGVLLLAGMILFCLIDARARAAFRHAEPWLALVFVLFIIAPYLAWLVHRADLGLSVFGGKFATVTGMEFASRLLIVHFGLIVLLVLVSGWPRGRRRELPPVIDGVPSERRARLFIYFFALAPALAAIGIVTVLRMSVGFEPLAPLVVLSGLAIIALAGGRVLLYRERLVSFAWLGLLVAPPILIVLGLGFLPWLLATEFRVSQPAIKMGRYFAESFQRRTGQPLQYVAGDQRLAGLVALGAPSRPSVFLSATPELSPWTNAARVREAGGVVVWPVTDATGAPPASVRAQFPELVAEVPRVFERPVEGRLPLLRIGWAVIKPTRAAAQ